MNDVVRSEITDAVAVITIDYPPVNALSHEVRQKLIAAFDNAAADAAVKAILIRGEGRNFIAGADIKEFDKPIEDPHLIEVINVLEAIDKLKVAALHGTTLGGGVELTLGCDYRCAAPGSNIGLPEVTLGIIPGANGTQRLPRLIGVKAALDMVTGGKPVKAEQALELGLIDRIIEGDLRQGAMAYAKELLSGPAPLRKVSAMPIADGSYPDTIFDDYRKDLAKRMRNQNAPQAAVDAIRAAAETSFTEGVKIEKRIADECVNSTESAALRHLFFASREVAKVPGIPRDIPLREIKKVAMIGAGTMGGGISMNFANVGVPVTLIDATEDALQSGLARVRKNYETSVKRGRMTAEQVEERMSLLQSTVDYAAVKDADLIIEAVFEDMDLKKEIFRKLDQQAKAGAVLASNTSTLDLNEIADSTSRPQDVIGLHFFSPANVMRLLEIVRGEKTADDVLATAIAMAKTIKKIGVVSGVCFGFIGNRMMESYGREANMLLLEGATPQQVDGALYNFGMAMGILSVYDMAGTDIGYKVHKAQPHLFPDDERYYLIIHKLAEMGRLGQKTGRGLYKYEEGSRTPIPDPEMQAMIEAESKRLGITRRKIDDDEIIQRCIYPMINEAALILEEGIALRPGDIDIIWTNGYGFPAYRGGPLFYADTVGLDNIYAAIRKFGDELGNEYGYWTPAPLLKELAESSGKFADLKPKGG